MSNQYNEFCLKKMAIKNKLLSQSIREDEKNGRKKYYVGKIMPCQFFKVSLKKLSSTQVLASEKLPKKYAISDATVPISLKNL